MKKAVLVCLLIFAVSIVSIGSYLNISARGNQKIKLNKSKITMKVGKRVKLKISPNRKHKIKWTSSKKKVASVLKGIVNAKKPGKTKIIARIGKKKLRCMVTVKGESDIVETPAPLEPVYSAVPPVPTETASPTIAPTETPTGTPIPEFTYPPYEFDPKVFYVGLLVPYIGENPSELFPELKISEIEDFYKWSYELFKDNTNLSKEIIEDYRKRIGTYFVITLAEESKQGVIDAINIILKKPNIKYAIPAEYSYPH